MKRGPLDAHSTLAVRPLDVAILLNNVHKSAQDEDTGFNDADITLAQMTTRMNRRKVPFKVDTVERALYCCNLMDEKGEFWHPLGVTFEDFLKSIAVQNGRPLLFDRFYNYFKARELA